MIKKGRVRVERDVFDFLCGCDDCIHNMIKIAMEQKVMDDNIASVELEVESDENGLVRNVLVNFEENNAIHVLFAE